MTVLPATQPNVGVDLRIRVVGVTALLLVEYLVASALIDATVINELLHLPESALSIGMLGPLVLAIITAIVGLRGRELLHDLSHVTDELSGDFGIAPWLVLHATGFGLAVAIPYQLAQSSEYAVSTPGFWLIAWATATIAAGIGGMRLVMPWRAWRPLARRTGLSLVIGTLFGVAAWAAAMSAGQLWGPLSGLTMQAVAGVLELITTEAHIHSADNLIALRDFAVTIAPQCAGYEGIGLTSVYLAAVLYMFRYELRLPQALIIIPLGIALIWAANVLRLVMLIWIGGYWSPEIASNGFHSKSGWVLFCAIALGLSVVARRSSFTRRNEDLAEFDCAVDPSAAYLLPMATLLAGSLLTGTFAFGFDPFYPCAYLIAACVAWWYRSAFESLEPSASWTAPISGLAVMLIWVITEPAAAAAPHPAMTGNWAGWAVIGWLTIRIVGSITIVPLVEELAFRGYLMRRITSIEFRDVSLRATGWLAIAISSLAFGLLHERWVVGIIAGLVFALTAKRTGRLSDAVVSHAVANAGIAVYAITTGHWSLIG